MPLNPKPFRSNSDVVGTKTHEAIEAEWLADFRSARGRPAGEGWMTINEMAQAADVHTENMRKYVHQMPDGYWESAKGWSTSKSGMQRIYYFYRKRPNLSTTKT